MKKSCLSQKAKCGSNDPLKPKYPRNYSSITESMKELVIDARCLASGIGTYGFNVLSRLSQTSLQRTTRIITTPALQKALSKFGTEITVLDVPIYSLQEQLQVPRHVPNASVVHALHYNAPVLHRGPLLVTIHDLTHILDRAYRSDWRCWLYARPMLLAAARRADHIFTGTQYVKNGILEHLKVSESKITISSYGVGEEFSPGDADLARRTVSRCTGSSSPYVLFVGNLKPHKNVENLLRAFAQLVSDKKFDHRLIVVGDDRCGRISVMRLIRDLHLEDRVQVIAKVTQLELVDFYRAADLLVLPSFQEGFGLPVAEAMACGTPVVCSRAASLPEVCGDAAEYFDPHRPEEMAHRIFESLDSSEKRIQTSKRGRERAKMFNWARTFDEHLRVYRNFLCDSEVTEPVYLPEFEEDRIGQAAPRT